MYIYIYAYIFCLFGSHMVQKVPHLTGEMYSGDVHLNFFYFYGRPLFPYRYVHGFGKQTHVLDT